MRTVGNEWIKFENAKIVAPILGAAFGIIFDIGYFYVIGLRFFTLFSLSEHILFAVTALPGVAVLVAFFYFFVIWSIRSVESSTEDQTSGLKDRGLRRNIVRHWPVYTFYVILGSVAIRAWWVKEYETAALHAAVILTVIVVRRWHRLWARPVVRFILPLTISLLFAFAMGCLVASNHLKINDTNVYDLHGKDAKVWRGRLLVSGDRGLLFFDFGTGRPQFRKWDGIDLLERIFW
jgi:hypothetical protein